MKRPGVAVMALWAGGGGGMVCDARGVEGARVRSRRVYPHGGEGGGWGAIGLLRLLYRAQL